MPHCNDVGLQLIEKFEGYMLEAYRDPVGIWTIGYGHTGPDVHPGEIISEDEAGTLLHHDVAWAEAAVAGVVEVVLTPNEFSALVSFVFNVGAQAFRGSTMLHLINSNDKKGAANQFSRWVFGNDDTPLLGLVRRRAAEKALFLSP